MPFGSPLSFRRSRHVKENPCKPKMQGRGVGGKGNGRGDRVKGETKRELEWRKPGSDGTKVEIEQKGPMIRVE